MSTTKKWTLALCCLAQFMVILDVSIVNVALPSIRGDLGFSATGLQWVVNAYTLAFAGFLLLSGRAADLLGRRRVLVAGLALFTVASLAGGLAPDEGFLVAARSAQGLGAGIVAPSALSILSSTFAEGAERNVALGAFGAMGAAGGAVGSLLGGVLTESLDWRWVLLINIPIGIAAVALVLRHIDSGRPARAPRFAQLDVAGAVSVTLGLVLVVLGIVGTNTYGWGSARTLAVLAAGVVILAGFLVLEARFAAEPIVPLRVFRSRTLRGANLLMLTIGGSTFAMWYFISLYAQQVLGFGPIDTGLAFIPMPVLIVAGSAFASSRVERLGLAPLLTVGLALVGTGLVMFSGAATDGSYVSDVLPASLVVALGLGLSFVPATIAAVAGARPGEEGLASGLANTSQQIGGSLGLAVLATLASSRTGGAHTLAALNAGFHRAFLVAGLIAFAGSAIAVLMLRSAKAPAEPGLGTPEPEPARS
jgi:EmrB/QacA subfamily drug resistance transporter